MTLFTFSKSARVSAVVVLCGAALSIGACSNANAPEAIQAESTTNSAGAPLQVADKAALMETVANYRVAADGANYDQVIALSMPPTFLGYFAKMGGTDSETMRAAIVGQMSTIMEQVESFEYNYDEANFQFENLTDGTMFVRMPLDVKMRIAGKTITSKDHNVGLYEDGKWYLVRVSEPELARMFREAYPKFKDIEFAEQQMTIAE